MSGIDHALNQNESGLIRYDGDESMANNIEDWLANPEGSVADNIFWGNNLLPYQHEPQNADTLSAIKMSVIPKMQRDIAGLVISHLGMSWIGKDLINMQVVFEGGSAKVKVNLAG